MHLRAPSRRLPTAVTTLAAFGLASGLWAQESNPALPEVEPAPIEQTVGEAYRLSPAEIDEALAIGGQAIDAGMIRSRMTVDVEINGKGPYRFVVDSGADTSVVSSKLAGQQGLIVGEPHMLQSMTDLQLVDRVLVDELRLGPTAFNDLQLPVLKKRHIGADGMIGLDALINKRLMMDFEKRTISVDDENTPAPLLDGVIVVTARLQRSQLILTEVKAQRVAVDAVIDTGTEISIGNLALRDQLMKRRGRKFDTVQIIGVTGTPATLEIGIISELKLGPVTLTNVPVAFADVPPFELFGIADKPSLLLGTDLMETFRKVSLDFHERKVRFQLKKCERSNIRIRTAPSFATRLSAERETACAR